MPWLIFTGSISNSSQAIIPIGSMIAANSMNSVSLMLTSMQNNKHTDRGIKMAMIPAIDSLKTVGLGICLVFLLE